MLLGMMPLCLRQHDFVYNFGTSDEPLQQITIVLPFAGYYQFDRLAVECQKLDTVAARAENLGAENLQNVTLGTNSLGGEITSIAVLKDYNAAIKEVKKDSYVILEHFCDSKEENEKSTASIFLPQNLLFPFNSES